MIKIFFIFLFFQTGQGFAIEHHQRALWPSQRPIRTMEKCIIEAERRQSIMNAALETSLDGIESVVILCRQGDKYEGE